jgi:hypothetical protein
VSNPRKRRGGIEAILGGADKRIEDRKEREQGEDPAPVPKTKQKVSYYLDQDAIVALEEIKVTLRKAGLSPRSASYSHIIEAAIKKFQQTLDTAPGETLARLQNTTPNNESLQ